MSEPRGDDRRSDGPDDVRVIAPNMNRRFSGVTASVIAVVPALAEHYPIRALGQGFPPQVPSIGWLQFLLRYRRGPWRIWHARRNIEMLAGIVLRYLFRFRLILVFTSAAQRHHSKYTRTLYGRMDEVIATTEAAGSFLVRPSVVVRHGVNTDFFHPSDDRARQWREMGGAGEFGIGIFGRIRPEKGTEEFVDALCAALPSFPRWGAALIGETTPKYTAFQNRLHQKVRKAGIEDRVRFVGKVEDFNTVPDWYRAMTVVVAPPWVEGFGLTCLEAMASGCAVVASRTGVFEEVIQPGETGWLVPCRDGDALEATLEMILDDPEMLAQVGLRSRRHIERHFTIQKEAESLAQIYDKLFKLYARDAGSVDLPTR